jgi:STE24 endopeptidase
VFGVSFGLTGPGDVAGLPLAGLGGAFAWVLLSPVAHACSRLHERRADRAALQLTGNPDAFIRAMTRMTDDRLAEERPPRLVELCWLSHPSPGARLDEARAWARGRPSTPGRVSLP